MSNIGISLKNSPPNLWFLFLIIVIIGGSFFSTSSGIRFLKIYFLFKYSLNEILSYSRPNNVYTNKFHLIDSNIEQNDINRAEILISQYNKIYPAKTLNSLHKSRKS